MGEKRQISRRRFIRGSALVGGGAILAACGATPTPEVIEKEVTRVVAGTAEVVKETVVVEKVVTAEVSTAAQISGELVIWQYPLSEDDKTLILDPLMGKFAEEQPGVTPRVDVVPWSGRREKLLAAVAAGAPPDIDLSSSDTMRRYVANNVFVPLDDCLAGALEGYTESALAIGRYEDQQYMAPIYGVCEGRIFNKALMTEIGANLDQPPSTWDEIRQYGPLAVEKGYYLFAHSLLDWSNTITLMWEAGGTVYSPDIKTVQLTAAPVVETLQFMVEWFQGKWVPEEGAVGSEQASAAPTTDYFLGKQQVMSGIVRPIYVTDVTRRASDIEVGIQPVFRYKSAASCYASGSWSITQLSKNKEAACEWVKFMVRDENLGFYCSVGGQVPARETARAFWVVDPLLRAFAAEVTAHWTSNQDSAAFWQESKVTCAPYFQAAVLGEMTVEEALQQAQTELQSIVNEYWKGQGG